MEDETPYFCNFTTPSGLSMMASSGMDGGHFYQTTLNMTNSAPELNQDDSPTDQLVTFAVLRVKGMDLDAYSKPEIHDLHECSLKWCAQTFSNVSVVNASTTSAAPSKTWTLETWNPNHAHGDELDPVGYWSRAMPGFEGIYNFDLDYAVLSIEGDTGDSVSNSTFTINANDFEAVQDYLTVVLASSRTVPPDAIDIATSSGSGSSQLHGASLDVSEPLLAAQSVPDLIAHVATSMTNNIRLNGNSSLDGRPVPNTANGTAYQTVTFVHVGWGWLSLPVLVVAVGACVLLAAIIQAGTGSGRDAQLNRVPLWRDSNVGLLYHGLDVAHNHHGDEGDKWEGDGAADITKTGTRRAVKDRAKEIFVSLEQRADGKMRFVPVYD